MEEESVGILWLNSRGTGESTWLESSNGLFGKINSYSASPKEALTPSAGPLVAVVHGLHRQANKQVVELLGKSKDMSVVVLSDEKLRHSVRKYRGARLILRNYFSPVSAWYRNTFTVPLGFVNGYERVEEIRPLSARQIPWAFFGQLKNNDRRLMMEAFTSVAWRRGKPEIHLTQQWNDPSALSPQNCAEKLRATVFVPCPSGNLNPETFRIMEALESGAIPVVTKFYGIDYFRFIFGDHPFVVENSWVLAAKRCQELLDDPRELSKKLHLVTRWYDDFLSNLQTDVASLLGNNGSTPLVSEQFRIQRRARRSIRVNWVFFFHFRLAGLRPRIMGFLDRFLTRN